MSSPGNENISFSRSSALGIVSSGNWDVKAVAFCEYCRLKIKVFLRSRFAWWEERPAVLKGSGDWEQGQGKAFSNCSIKLGAAGFESVNRGLLSSSSKEILLMGEMRGVSFRCEGVKSVGKLVNGYSGEFIGRLGFCSRWSVVL